MNMRMSLRPWLLAVLFSGFAWSAVAAQTVYDTPLYFEPNDTYYELVSIANQYNGRFPKNVTGWPQVRRLAASRTYKGRRGRLATVKSKEVNDFLRDAFKPDTTAWIGLRYWCKFKKFMWVTAEVLRPGDYRNFGRIWNIHGFGGEDGTATVSGCSAGWLPVHYWPAIAAQRRGGTMRAAEYGFHWNANGFGKHWPAFFVEYPPPRKTE